VDGEDIGSSGLVNGELMMYTPRCRCGVQVDRQPDDGLSRRAFGSFLTARMGVNVGRLPQEVLLEESYRNECSSTIQVGRVHVFEELLAVLNCSVLTIWSAINFHREYRTRVRYSINRFICVMVKCGVLFEVWAESCNIKKMSVGFIGLRV
jgi:hypothetical protein